LQIQLDNT